MKQLIVYILLLLCPYFVSAKVIYVDKGLGSDANSGLSKVNVPAGSGPLATIKLALTKVGINDTLSIASGNYDESIVLKQDLYVVMGNVVRLKTISLNGSKSITKLTLGKLIITDSLQLKNGELFVQSKATLVLGLNCLVLGGSQSSFVNGNLHRAIGTSSAAVLFPLGLTHSYRPVSIKLFDNIVGTDTVCVGLIDSNMGNLKVAGIRNFNQFFHGQIRFYKTVNNRFYLQQYFGSYFLNNQVVDTANLKLLYYPAGVAQIGGYCDSFLDGNGSITYLVRASKSFVKFTLSNKQEGANALGNPGVYAFFKLNKKVFCKGEEGYLDNVSLINGSSQQNCVWYIDVPKTGKRNSLATTNATYIFKDTGNIEIWLIVTDSLNRVDTFKQKVRVKPVSGKLNINNVCFNKPSTFNIVGLSAKDYSVSWYIDKVFYNFKDTLVLSKLSEKSYQVRAAIQSTIENCEYYLDSFLLTSNAPTISKIHIDDSCNVKNSTVTATVIINSLDKSTLYDWSLNGKLISNKSTFRFPNDSFTKQQIRLFVSNEFGCSSIYDTFVLRNAIRIDSIGVKVDCSRNELNLTNHLRITAGVNHNTQWFNGDSLLPKVGDKIVLPRSNYVGTLKVKSISDIGCTDSSNLSLSKYTIADVTAKNLNSSRCVTDTLVFEVKKLETIDKKGYFEYNGLTYLVNPLKLVDPISGVKRVVWKSNNYGCNDSIVQIVNTSDIPRHDLLLANNKVQMCNTSVETLKITNFSFVDTVSYNYEIFNDKIYTTSLSYPDYTFNYLGKQIFYSTITHKKSACKFSDTLTINVVSKPSLLTVWDKEVCDGEDIKVNLFKGANGGTGKLNWEILFDGKKYNDSAVVLSGLAPGNYSAKSKVTDSLGCIDSLNFNSIVKKLPDYTFGIIGQMPICPGDSLEVDLSSADGDVQWDEFGLNPGVVVFKSSGKFAWKIIGSNGCNYGDDFLVIADTAFKLKVTKDTSIISGSPIVLSASGAASYVWTPKKYVRSYRGNSMLVKPTNDIIYKVRGISDVGCELMDSVIVSVRPALAIVKIPNVITANKDGLNDVWDLSVVRDIESCIIRIYDANNKLVKELEKYQNNYTFSDVKPGMYFYTISRKSNILHKGSLEVFK